MKSRVDLHIHSRVSDRSAEWLFRRMHLPDSYSDPREIYHKLRERGMDFVTLTDHNRIEGCLEIADLPGTFISEEVTTYFPEDRCKVHLLVWGITEAQHQVIGDARENIFELRDYLKKEDIAHAVAHPLYQINDKMGVHHIESLLNLFTHFETINGLRSALLGKTLEHLLEDRYVKVGGSDDHGGVYPARAWTETRAVASPGEFLAEIRAGACEAHGVGGTPLVLSHSLYKTVYQFSRDKFSRQLNPHAAFVEKIFSRFMEGEDPTRFSFGEKMNFLAQGILSGKIFDLAKPGNASLWKEYADYFGHIDLHKQLAAETKDIEDPERRAFLIANLFANQLAFRFFLKFIKQISSGSLVESVQSLTGMLPMLLALSPYWYAFRSQSPSREWLRSVAQKINGSIPAELKNNRRAWFTDTLEDVNGVANTIRRMTAAGIAAGADLTVVTSRTEISITDIPIKNFPPIGEFELPEYELQKLSFPPILHMIDYIQREGFTELIISTPGPVGFTAWLAGKMLGLRMVGIYHTDFPQYIRILTDDSFLESLAWSYMHWFYTRFDVIFVNSEHYRQAWSERGIDPIKLKILPRGLDTTLFHPRQRTEGFWEKYGRLTSEIGILYVGRISREKDLEVLIKACDLLAATHPHIRPLIVGDGPFLEEMKRLLPRACFTGYLAGIDLARAYASADLFVFPSTTDTFGNVVIEAQASGLPCIVSDVGGPVELIAHGEDGLITKALDAGELAQAILRLAEDAGLRGKMAARSRARVEERNWDGAFASFWAMSPE